MPQVFISYARTDKRKVAKVVAALRTTGFEPWWDDDIPPGAGWEETIERALADADVVIVCWSAASVTSENVRSEARLARSRGKLVQTFLEPCEPPLFFGERQGIDLTGWNGSAHGRVVERLKQALEQVLSPTPEPPRPVQSPQRRRPTAAVASVAFAFILAVAALAWWRFGSSASAGPARIAVQPIASLGGDRAVADGLTDELVSSLNDGHVPTITRADSESLRSGDLNAKLAALNADYSINGTIESNKGTLRARLHLDDRVHHASLWSYEANGPADDPGTFYFSTGQAVAGVLSCVYRGLGPNGLADTDLLSRYVRVCDLFVNHNDASDAKSTFELLGDLRQITAKAPNFAPAHSDLAKFGAYLAPLMPPDQAASVRAESARQAKIALSLDEHSADAWLARELLVQPTDWEKREALIRKAVSVNPDWPHSNGFLGMFLMETGRMREAAVYGQRAAAADLQIDWRPYGAQMACEAGQAEQIIPELRQQLSNAPNDPVIKWSLRSCLSDAGRFREAQALLSPVAPGATGMGAYVHAAYKALSSGAAADRAQAGAMARKVTLDNFALPGVIEYSAALGDLDTAFMLADRFSPGHPMTGITGFLFGPMTAPMRSDPRFFPLMKRYGLAQFWQSTGRWPDFCSGPQLSRCKAAVAARLASR